MGLQCLPDCVLCIFTNGGRPGKQCHSRIADGNPSRADSMRSVRSAYSVPSKVVAWPKLSVLGDLGGFLWALVFVCVLCCAHCLFTVAVTVLQKWGWCNYVQSTSARRRNSWTKLLEQVKTKNWYRWRLPTRNLSQQNNQSQLFLSDCFIYPCHSGYAQLCKELFLMHLKKFCEG